MKLIPLRKEKEFMPSWSLFDDFMEKFFNDVMSTGIVNAIQMSDLPDQIKALFETGVKADKVAENIAAIINMNRALKALGTDLATFIGDMNFDDFRQKVRKMLM